MILFYMDTSLRLDNLLFDSTQQIYCAVRVNYLCILYCKYDFRF